MQLLSLLTLLVLQTGLVDPSLTYSQLELSLARSSFHTLGRRTSETPPIPERVASVVLCP